MNTIIDITMNVLNLFYSISFNNYGVAIILLTIAVKISLYPLTLQSTKQMNAMQKIQPKFDELKAKYKNKPEKLQQEIIELYKEHGVNPLGGCMPLLLQMPIFIALFMTLTSDQFKQALFSTGAASNFLWIKDLSLKDPYLIMPILIGITTYWSQKTMPASGPNEQTKALLMIMPFFIAFVSVEFAAGVQLYWLVQNILTIAQQIYIMNNIVKQ